MTTTPSALTAPQDELGVLGACLNGGVDVTAEVLSMVSLDMVINDQVRDTLSVLAGMMAEGCAITSITVDREWRKAFPSATTPFVCWSEAQDLCPSPETMAGFFADGVRAAFRRRKLATMAQEVLAGASDPSVDIEALAGRVEAAMGISEATCIRPQSSRDVAKDFIDDLQTRMERQGGLSGITTGLARLDQMTDGMQPGEMWVIGARPSIGKTAIAVNMLEACSVNGGIPSMFISHEMNNTALMRRLVASLSRIDLGYLKSGSLDDRQQQRMLTTIANKISAAPVHWLQLIRGENIDVVCSQIRRAVRKHGIRVVFVDYLQKIPPSKAKEKRTYEVAEVSTKLKNIASATGVTLVALAQANRDSEKDKPRPPRMSELSDCSQIEKDADFVGLLHRDRQEKVGDGSLIVAKQRDGECGMINLTYNGGFCRFEEQPRERPE